MEFESILLWDMRCAPRYPIAEKTCSYSEIVLEVLGETYRSSDVLKLHIF
jgi:hypothetical protein